MEDLVSIIIPAYNAGIYFRTCLDSLVNQTYQNLEILIANDASLDDTLAIAQCYAAKDTRIRVINQEKNLGNGATRNRTLKYATGKYLYFIDADDYLELNAIELCVKKMIETDADTILLGSWRHKENGVVKKYASPLILGKYEVENIFSTYIAYETCYYAPWMFFTKRDFVLRYGIYFDESRLLFEDNIYTIKLMYFSQKVGAVEDLIYHYIFHPGQASRIKNAQKIFKSCFHITSVFKEFLESQHAYEKYQNEYLLYFIRQYEYMLRVYKKIKHRNKEIESLLKENNHVIQNISIEQFSYLSTNGFDITKDKFFLKCLAKAKRGFRYMKFRRIKYRITHMFKYKYQ